MKNDADVFAEACHRLITDGICRAECCGPIPLSRELIDKHFDMIQEVRFTDIAPAEEGFAFLLTDDLMCVFLHRDTCHCTLYEERPDVCRKFGDESHPQMRCPWLLRDGRKRTRAERRRLVDESKEGQEKLKDYLAEQRDITDWRW